MSSTVSAVGRNASNWDGVECGDVDDHLNALDGRDDKATTLERIEDPLVPPEAFIAGLLASNEEVHLDSRGTPASEPGAGPLITSMHS